ncbi:response regulator transcription factor [Dactylosporangium sp. CA-233914]|uniref:response regulator transcription factor n=1 Tax=Dactylosporangium sp. CA-233914 TaxID=3239934 RepID=UPI003D8B4EC5
MHKAVTTEASGFRLLVVSPDAETRGALAARLSVAGYTVTSTATGAGATRLLTERRIDLVVIDVAIPDLQKLAQERPTFPYRPLVLCMASSEALQALIPEVGTTVEDYVTKPCRTLELLARVQVLLRGRSPASASVLRYSDLVLDEGACRVWRSNRALQLTAAEYRLLRHLLLNTDMVLSKEQLAWHIWDGTRGANAIERLVSRLRQKVDEQAPTLIHTRRGFGYWLGRPATAGM